MNSISSKSAKELYDILQLLPEEQFSKIATEEINYINLVKDNNYITNISNINDVNSNNVSEETKKYLAYIFLNYLSDGEEKEEYEKILKENEKRFQKELNEKYDISKIFNQEIKQEKEEVRTSNDVLLNIDKDKNVVKAIFQKIKRFIEKNFFEILEILFRR